MHSQICRFFDTHSRTRFSCRQIKVDSIFTSYRIQSNANNEITVSLSSEALLATLKSASSSASSSYETDEVVMKLAKKNDQAVLSFEINGLTRLGKKVRVAHDVKIEVMKPGDVARLSEPLCPEPDVSYSPSYTQIIASNCKLSRPIYSFRHCKSSVRSSNVFDPCQTS